MTAKGIVIYWHTSASRDWKVAQDLFRLKHFSYCLFFCHLAIEKLLKGLIYKNTKDHPLLTHSIEKLVKQAQLLLPKFTIEELDEVTSWNIEARYDSFKQKFYKKATKEFTTQWFSKAKEIFVCLENQY